MIKKKKYTYQVELIYHTFHITNDVAESIPHRIQLKLCAKDVIECQELLGQMLKNIFNVSKVKKLK